MTVELALSGFGLAAWLYLILARGGFWRADIRDEVGVPPTPAEWPSVIAVVPARNEVDVIANKPLEPAQPGLHKTLKAHPC